VGAGARGTEGKIAKHVAFAHGRFGNVGGSCVPGATGGPGNINAGEYLYVDLSAITITDCAADFNGDGAVNIADLGTLLANFGAGGASFADGDANGDGNVNVTDLGMLLAEFGAGC